MKELNQSVFLQLVDSDDQMKEFADFTIHNISYMDYLTVDEEIKKMNRSSHVMKYWIKSDDKIIGAVKLSIFHFYDLALQHDLSSDDYELVLQTIEDRLSHSFSGTIHGHILYKYLEIARQNGWVEDYSRYQMGAELINLKTVDYSDLKYSKFEYSHISKLANLFADAYSGSKDEQIGMITKNTVNDSVTDIISGKYGELQDDLSVLVFNAWGKLIGASLITLSEGCAFLVIIGMRRKYQRRSIGKKMLSYNIDRSIAAGHSYIKLWVTAGIPAVDFYRSFGFEELTKVTSVHKSKLY